MLTDPPQVTLQLGNKLNPDTIKENDDVYFECNIRANPKKYKITWLHNVSIFAKYFMLECNIRVCIYIYTHIYIYICLLVKPRNECEKGMLKSGFQLYTQKQSA